MADRRALVRLVDELVWSLRRIDVTIAPSQAIDLLRAVEALGWDDPWALREAILATAGVRREMRPRALAVIDAFFAGRRLSLGLYERLREQGFSADEVAAVRSLLTDLSEASGNDSATLGALLEGGSELDHLLQLSGIRRELGALRSPLQTGFYVHRIGAKLGVRGARERLAVVRRHLKEALGERGDALADALVRELDGSEGALRERVREAGEEGAERTRLNGEGTRLDDKAFTALTDQELEEVTRAVRSFADRLRGAERVRRRRAQRGRLDVGRTMRMVARTGGVPFKPVRRRKRRDKTRLVLLCDISDSVRTASRFMLELVYAAHELFARTRSFVFVSEIGETTRLFEDNPPRKALAAAYGGAIVPVTANSNYGRVLSAFDARYLDGLDRRTTVVVLGDGRTNYHEAREELLGRIRERVRALYWLSTEPRGGWAAGDSAMARYEPHCTKVMVVTTARELEEAARELVWRR